MVRLDHHVPINDGRNVFLEDVREQELNKYREMREKAARLAREKKETAEVKKTAAKKVVPAKKATSSDDSE